ncbi:MAG: hypothetical protein LQ352_007531 [Teloschistes flavicans]|nr:MAG: hypothetical protein LQ352_007531 [Teloschistes flavicans]
MEERDQEQEQQQHSDREALPQPSGITDFDAVRIVNQSASKVGKLPRPSKPSRPNGHKKPEADPFELNDDEPPAKRLRSAHAKHGEAEPSDPTDIPPASPTIAAATNLPAPAPQHTAPRRGRPRATKSQSTVIGKGLTHQLRSQVVLSPKATHHPTMDASDAGDAGASVSQHIQENDSVEDEESNASQENDVEDDDGPHANAGAIKAPDAAFANHDVLVGRGHKETNDLNSTGRDAGLDESGPGLELFGHDSDWKAILAAKKRIGFSKNKKVQKNKGIQGNTEDEEKRLPKLTTIDIRRFIKVIGGARRIYQSTTEIAEIPEAVKKLHQSVVDLSEASCKDGDSQVITDIYAHAVPKLVDLLWEVLKVRRRQLQDKSNLTVVEEVICVQSCLLILCTKARNWRAKPDTSVPIMKPTSQIKPAILSMHSGFQKQYDQRKRRLKRIANYARSCQEDKIRSEKQKQDERKTQLEIEERQRLLGEDLIRRHKELRRVQRIPNLQRKEPPVRKGAVFASIAKEWSKEQNRALLTALENLAVRSGRTAHPVKDAYTNSMTVEERYLEALKDPLLRNRRLEDIAERARHYKSVAESALWNDDIPRWLQDIE